MERAVELVGFDDDILTLGSEDVVRAVVLGNPSQKSIAVDSTFVEHVRRHGRSRGLAVRARHTKSFFGLGECAEYLCTFVYFEATLAKPLQLAIVVRNGGCVNHECRFRIAAKLWNLFRIVFEMEDDAFFDERVGQCRWRAIIAGHVAADLFEVAFESAHADAAGTEEENGGILHCNE